MKKETKNATNEKSLYSPKLKIKFERKKQKNAKRYAKKCKKQFKSLNLTTFLIKKIKIKKTTPARKPKAESLKKVDG